MICQRRSLSILKSTVKCRIIRHEAFLDELLFQDRMPSVADLQDAFVGNLWTAIIMQPRRFGKRSQHIELRERGSRLLDFWQLAQNFLAHALEQFRILVSRCDLPRR